MAVRDGKLQAFKAEVEPHKVELEAYKAGVKILEAQIKVCVVTMTKAGVVQISGAPRGNILRPRAFQGPRSAREIDNFLWGLGAYFRAMTIEDDAQKVSNVVFSLKDIALFGGVISVMMLGEDLIPLTHGTS